MKNSVIVVIVSILALAELESLAIIYGIDGYYFSVVVGAIAAAIGVVIPNPFRDK